MVPREDFLNKKTRIPSAMAALRLALLLAHLRVLHGLPALVPGASCGKGGRWGLCAYDAGVGTLRPAVLRGSNYIRLHSDNHYHSTFDADTYNRTRYNLAMKAMRKDGYNINRVFLDETPGRGIGGGTNNTAPLDGAWLDRLAEFISDAESYRIYTIVTMVYIPTNSYFLNFSESTTPSPSPAWNNSGLNRLYKLVSLCIIQIAKK